MHGFRGLDDETNKIIIEFKKDLKALTLINELSLLCTYSLQNWSLLKLR